MNCYVCGCEGTIHDQDCPFSDDVGDNLSDPPSDKGMGKGWECPVCGRGNAPWVAQCSCTDSGPSLGSGRPDPTVTGYTSFY